MIRVRDAFGKVHYVISMSNSNLVPEPGVVAQTYCKFLMAAEPIVVVEPVPMDQLCEACCDHLALAQHVRKQGLFGSGGRSA